MPFVSFTLLQYLIIIKLILLFEIAELIKSLKPKGVGPKLGLMCIFRCNYFN